VDTAALKESWAQVAKCGDDVPLFFYSHLFLSRPELREMFPISMSAQRDKLVGALGQVVSNVDELDNVVPYLRQLGRDHRRFSVVAEHYNDVGRSLLTTLRHFLGPAWTESLANDWAAAYGLVAKTMVLAAEEAEEDTPAWWDADVAEVERRSVDVTVIQLKPHQALDFQPGQSMAMEIPQRPRQWRYYSPANAPRSDGSIELHVQPVDGGQVSGAVVRALKVGDTVRLGAPVGNRLTLADPAGRDLLMVAGGTGLAPLCAILEQIDATWQTHGSGPHVHLFHGVRVPWNLYEHDRFSRLAQQPWFDYQSVVSDDPSYPGARGLVGTRAARHQRWDGRTALVCGGPAMVEHTVAELVAAGVPETDIRREEFVAGGHAPAAQGAGESA